ncbi:MAG: hypothetical protein KBS53_04835 [Bacteroidales bacterium]|nr:hypothetical protein [Candidatus Hennigimonas equi]
MKKFILTGICAFTTLCATAQAKLETKKFKISDLCERTMEIVLTGNPTVDAAYRDKVQDVWYISPYELCTAEQFEQRKKSKEYYFIVVTDNSFGKETSAGIKFLSMYKGDPKAREGVDGLYKITSIPFCSENWGDGREANAAPAMLNTLQQQALSILGKEFNIGEVARVKSRNAMGEWPGKVLIADCDLAFQRDTAETAGSYVKITDSDTVAEAMENREDCLVGYSVAPENSETGSVCFTYLINAATYELYYMRKRSISPSSPAGFTKAELKGFESHGSVQ